MGGGETKKLLEAINSKLERLIGAVEKLSSSKPSNKEVPVEASKPVVVSAKTESVEKPVKKEAKKVAIKKAKK
jgi:hypothetical protein